MVVSNSQSVLKEPPARRTENHNRSRTAARNEVGDQPSSNPSNHPPVDDPTGSNGNAGASGTDVARLPPEARHEQQLPNNDEDIGRTVIADLGSRRTDFNERTWWMVDLESFQDATRNSNNPQQGATGLVARCMRVYDWEEDNARKVLKGYRQFLSLKKELQDWDTTRLCPSPLVEKMWHQHILDTQNYHHDMILLCGQVVTHNPDDEQVGDSFASGQRYQFTREEIQRHFSEAFDEDIWPSSDEIQLNRLLRQGQAQQQEEPNRNNPVAPVREGGDQGNQITIAVVNWRNEETYFRLNRSTRLSLVFETYAARHDLGLSSLKFLFNDEVIQDDTNATPTSINLADQGRIKVMLNIIDD